MIWGVGEVLRLKAKPVSEIVYLAPFACECPIKEITAVKLDARFGGQNFHNATASGFINSGDHAKMTRKFICDPVMIISIGKLELLVGLTYAGTYCGGFAEIKWSAPDRCNFTRWNEVFVHRSELAGMESYQMTENVPSSLPCKVEVTVVSQVDDGRTVCLGTIDKFEFVFVRERVGSRNGKISWISLLPILAVVSELQGRPLLIDARDCFPKHLVKSTQTAMQ